VITFIYIGAKVVTTTEARQKEAAQLLLPWGPDTFNVPVALPLFLSWSKQMPEETPPYIDRRDAAVIEALIEGEVYSVTQITRLYKLRTDIRNDKTAKNRKDTLVATPAFENVDIGFFRYVGVE